MLPLSQLPDTALPGTGLNGSLLALVQTPLLIRRMDCNGPVIPLFLHKETMLRMAKIVLAMDYGLWPVKVETHLQQVLMELHGQVALVSLFLLLVDGA
jgi:hypothetical protein